MDISENETIIDLVTETLYPKNHVSSVLSFPRAKCPQATKDGWPWDSFSLVFTARGAWKLGFSPSNFA